YWFAETSSIVANHLLSADLDDVDPADLPAVAAPRSSAAWSEDGAPVLTYQLDPRTTELRGRSMLCRRVDVLPIECIVRGYVSGSGWKDYQATGSICGIRLPGGLRESDQLREPIFTPSTKAELG